ncbi:isoleucine--tRNA ligase [Candidatus Nanohalococcus occultus]|uniref:Isoleucine--tRNA ligase n=1 Tax=Candidatus Nanohalococcus occultus TaxID=2978047 RepID=A0ABY8CHI7_9ARCH|nr:Isoleucyl-tRNA synthetase [Candidatus Nanohaloarchaeota archaeon SVXNc]
MTEYNPQQLEENVKQFWEENDVKQKVRNSTEGNDPFYLVDGPPYLNGAPHVGHMQGKVLKDVMLRFKQMQGFDVWDQAGFDTHGLPNELATEEELGVEDKNEIGKSISAAEFIEKCKERATSAQDLWKGVMGDLAIWQDFEDPYMTYDPEYIESEWWLVSQVEEQDLLYKDLKPIHWCPRCQTSLSGYEVTDAYKDVEDLAVYVKFPLAGREEKVVIWTTTPWTIPANMAVFVHPNIRYARVELNGEKLIIAEELVGEVLGKAGYSAEDYEILDTMVGSDLESMKYEHPMVEEAPKQKELDEENNVHRIHTSDSLVTLEDGTGLVHAATGHGQEDFEETRHLDIPIFSPVDREGKYTEEVEAYEGEYVHDVNEKIRDRLDEKGLLLNSEGFQHEYPHCWRCKTKLVYRAAEQWFIENNEVKERMLEENKDVDWIPDEIKKRFSNFVEDSPDWCISRQNYWGVPVPIWECSECGDYEVIGSFEQLEEKAGGLPEDFDPHKHHVDPITWSCECGGEKQRVEDILDVWFDSGSAPFASLHYPFDEEPFESMFPMDFITEASDQIRGWFYSLMFCGILGFDEVPYEKVLFQAHVLDEKGKKMSKSVGNVVDPVEQIEEYGADLPRFYSMRVAPAWEQTKYDETEIRQEIYRLFSVYWNTVNFLTGHGLEVNEEPESLEIEDRWMLSRIESITEEAQERMENCVFHKQARELEEFVLDDLSRWYVKKVRQRVKNGDRAASWTLRQVLEKVNKLFAPLTPFISEKVYQELEGEKLSVHMESFPEADQELIDESLEVGMDLAREVVEESNKIRDKNEYNLRWPAKKLTVSTGKREDLERFVPLIKEMANVKAVEFGDVESRITASPDYSSLGPKFGGDADKVAGLIEDMENEQVNQLNSTGTIILDDYEISEEDVEFESHTVGDVNQRSFSAGEVFLDLEVTPEIEQEAFVSEVIRAIQQKRKEAGLEMEDAVEISFEGDYEPVKEHEDSLKERVKIESVEYGSADKEFQQEVNFEDERLSEPRTLKFSFSKPVA